MPKEKSQQNSSITETDIEEIKRAVKRQVSKTQRESFIKNMWYLLSFTLAVMGLIVALLGLFGLSLLKGVARQEVLKYDEKFKQFVIEQEVENLNIKNNIKNEIFEYKNEWKAILRGQRAEFDNLKQTSNNMIEDIKNMSIKLMSEHPEWDDNINKIIEDKVGTSTKIIQYQQFMQRGKKAYDGGDLESAIDYFKDALEVSPNDINSLDNLALLYKNLKPDTNKYYSEVLNYMKGAIEAGYKDSNEAVTDGFKKYFGDKVFNKLFFSKNKT